MNSEIRLVGWDADRVMYNDLITSICAKNSPLDPQPYVQEFIENGWFSYDDVKRWADYKGLDPENPIQNVGNLADCLTDFLYNMKKEGSHDSVLTKPQTIASKQAILKGLTIADIEKISEGIEYTDGLVDAVNGFKEDGRIQSLYSDGLGPHVTYQIRKLGLDEGKGIPPIVSHGGREFLYLPGVAPNATLTGKIGKMDKAIEFMDYAKGYKIPMENIAIIDDSGSNIANLHKPVRDGGGIALGFNVTEAHKSKFHEASIPILKGDNLEPFIEIVRDPREVTIAKYCD